MKHDYQQEIIDLHQFFQEYFTGEIPFEAVLRFDSTLADGFTLVDSGANITDDDEIKNIIRQLHGQRKGIRIWVENVLLRHETDEFIVATYEEWQATGEKTTQRASSVVFKKDASAPNGVLWLHVHESGLREV